MGPVRLKYSPKPTAKSTLAESPHSKTTKQFVSRFSVFRLTHFTHNLVHLTLFCELLIQMGDAIFFVEMAGLLSFIHRQK